MSEKWVPVPGHEGLYEVSDQGRVRSLPRISLHRNGFRRRVDGQILRQFPMGRYKQLQLSLPDSAGKASHLVHRLVLRAFRGEPADGMVACHNNGDAHDNRLSNLRWDTPLENSRDVLRHGHHRGASKTHCPRGHAYEGLNLTLTRGGRGRECKACNQERRAAQRQKRAFDSARADERYVLLTEHGRAVEVEGPNR